MGPSPFAATLAAQLVETLSVGQPGLFNPWRERCPFDTPGNGPAARLERLACHLDCDPLFILVGEAPGYQGCRYSGIAFTSERLLLEGAIPRIPVPPGRLSQRDRPFSEPSATIVWKALVAAGLAGRTILWNALQLHPHKTARPWSNRTPTDAELDCGAAALHLLVAVFPKARFVAVGRKAEGLMARHGIASAATVRHPANGGATAFTAGIMALAR